MSHVERATGWRSAAASNTNGGRFGAEKNCLASKSLATPYFLLKRLLSLQVSPSFVEKMIIIQNGSPPFLKKSGGPTSMDRDSIQFVIQILISFKPGCLLPKGGRSTKKWTNPSQNGSLGHKTLYALFWGSLCTDHT